MRHELVPAFCIALLGAAPLLCSQAGWQNRGLATQPPHYPALLEWIPARGTMWWFGQNVTAPTPELWEFDGQAWRAMAVANGPLHVSDWAGAYDVARQRLVVWGNQQTWEFDGRAWTRHRPANQPSPRDQHAMAYDAARGEVLLFGGRVWDSGQGKTVYFGDLWAWDGFDWTLRSANGPSPRGWSAMAYHPRRKTVILHGGWYTVPRLWQGQQTAFHLGDTMEWDGSAWSAMPGGGGARKGHSMAYDALRDRVVMFGGSGSTGYGGGFYYGDTLELDGTAWVQVATGGPVGRNDSKMAFDAARERIVLTGGFASGAPGMQDTWEFATPFPAAFATFGSGCVGGHGAPALELVGTQLPWVGDIFAVRATRLPPSPSPVAFLLGGSNTSWRGQQLPYSLAGLGASGCSLLVRPDVVLGVTNQGGSAILSLAVPVSTSILGAAFYDQAFAADPPANALGVVVSDGSMATVGQR